MRRAPDEYICCKEQILRHGAESFAIGSVVFDYRV